MYATLADGSRLNAFRVKEGRGPAMRRAPVRDRFLAAASVRSGPFQIHAQAVSSEHLAIETRNCRTRLVAFHLDETEPSAASGEKVAYELSRAHFAVGGEHFGKLVFGAIGWQIAGVNSQHGRFPNCRRGRHGVFRRMEGF